MNISNLVNSLKKINFKDKKVQTVVAIVLAGVMMIFGWYKYLYEPLSLRIVELRTDQESKQAKLNAILAMKPQLERIRAEIVSKGILLDSLKSIFPDSKEVPKLLQEITRLSNAANVHTTRFSPMADVQQEYYVENRYMITMWSGYHEFASFLANLANLRLIINLSDVKLATHPLLQSSVTEAEKTGLVPQYTIEATFTLTTFSSRK